MALQASLDKQVYEPGETMTLTVTTEANERNRDKTVTAHVFINEVGEMDVTGKVKFPPELVIVTDPSRSWTKQNDDGQTAVYTAVA